MASTPADIPYTCQTPVCAATVIIRYVDQTMAKFAKEQRARRASSKASAPDPAKVPEGYTLTGQGEFQVEVTDMGANPADITFTYQKPVAPATVIIHYVDQTMAEFANEQRELPAGSNAVAPDPAKVPEGYTLTGQGEFQV